MSQQASDTLVQILFGRYRDWGTLTIIHLIVLSASVALSACIYFAELTRRNRAYRSVFKTIPRKQMPITRTDQSHKSFKHMFEDVVFVENMFQSEFLPEQTTCPGDAGWGRVRTQHEGSHFTQAIAQSFTLLERAALARRPTLFHRNHRTIRNYMAELRKAFPNLPLQLCEFYLQAYEKAVFGDHKFTEQEYVQAESVIMDIVKSMSASTF